MDFKFKNNMTCRFLHIYIFFMHICTVQRFDLDFRSMRYYYVFLIRIACISV